MNTSLHLDGLAAFDENDPSSGDVGGLLLALLDVLGVDVPELDGVAVKSLGWEMGRVLLSVYGMRRTSDVDESMPNCDAISESLIISTHAERSYPVA